MEHIGLHSTSGKTACTTVWICGRTFSHSGLQSQRAAFQATQSVDQSDMPAGAVPISWWEERLHASTSPLPVGTVLGAI